MLIVPSHGCDPAPLARVSPDSLARRHSLRSQFRRLGRSASTFLRSLRSRPVTALPRYYGRSDSCPIRRGSARVISRRPPDRLLPGQVSLIHALGLPAIPSPTTGASPDRLRTPSRIGPVRPPSCSGVGLRSSSAGSPHRVSRIEFVILRTGRSPPAALYPVLRRRSGRRITVRRWIVLERTFTSLTKCAFRRTDASLRSA